MNKIGEQSDGSLILPNGDIITLSERNKIINTSLDTPIRAKEKEIKDIIEGNNSSILIGETGSGKTTELPQIIHELYPNDIIITNIPLVAATMGTANYVSKILYCKTGNPYYILGNGGVGYRTGKGVSEQKRTQIGFHTYGLDYLNIGLGNFERFLNTSDKNIHIILDEIHEKNEDFLFYLPRVLELIKKYPNRVKAYGTSATISDNYLDKLLDNKKGLGQNTPVIRVDGRTFPIEDIIVYGASTINEAIKQYNLGKSILIFEPGKGEIRKVIEKLKKELGENIIIQEFHSQITQEQLNLVLNLEGVQKIFVGTNAARTGVTLDINSVVDSGLQKMQYYNEYGIPILLKEGISYDAYMQNRGRSGRKEKGVATYTGVIKIEDMPEESKASIEIKVDEKKILTEIFNGITIKQLQDRLLFEPNKRMLGLSINRMKQAGLITNNNKLTTVGFEVLKFPVSVFNGRILVEAMELGIVDKLIPYVAILEERGFITKKFNIKKFKQDFFQKDFSDLEIQDKLFNIFFEKELSEDILGYLYGLGIDGNKIDTFRYSKDLLIDILNDEDFLKIGLNKKNILSIKEKIEKIKKIIKNYKPKVSRNLNLGEKELRELISKAILAGNLFNLYEAKSSTKFEAFYDETGNDLEFEKSETSYVDILPGSIYAGEPFIIGGDNDDKNIFSLITRVEQGDISYFESKKYKEYKKTNKESVSDFSVDFKGDTFVIPKYLQDLDQKKKYLAINWLPYFLLRKNEFFIKYRDDYKQRFGFFDEDTFIKLLGKITIKVYPKLSLDKQENIKQFIGDDELLKAFLNSNDKEIIKFRTGEKQEKEVLKVDIVNEENLVLTYIKKIREYNKILKEAKTYINKNKIDIEQIEKETLNKIISFLEENSSEYSKLIIFLKKEENKGIKSIFKEYEKLNEQYEKILKNIDWLEGFINGLKKIKQRETESLELSIEDKKTKKKKNLELLKFSNIDKKELLLKDPIIYNLGILDDIKGLQKGFKNIKKILGKLDFNSNKLIGNLIRFLAINNRIYNRGVNYINKFFDNILIEIKNLQNEKNELLNTYSLKAEDRNKKIKNINKQINNLYILRKNLLIFIKGLKIIRGKLSNIEFKNLLLSSISEESKNNLRLKTKKKTKDKTRKIFKHSYIYNKKFLYNLVIEGIFSGEDFVFSNKTFEEKLIKKITKLIQEELSEEKIVELIEILKVYVNSNSKNNSFNKLDGYIVFFENLLKKYKKQEELLVEKMNSDNFLKIRYLMSLLENMLISIFSEKKVDINNNKIYNFAKKFSSYNVNNFDNNLKELLVKIGLFNKNKLIGNIGYKLGEYIDLFEEINNFLSENEDIGDQEILDEILIIEKIKELEGKIELIKSKTIKLKEIKETLN